MIPSLLTRHLSRPTVAMTLRCARPAIGSQPHLNQRPAQQSFFSGDAPAPTDNNNGTNGKDDSHHTTKDSLASILRDELKLSAKESKRAVDTIFDTIVEVRSTACCVLSTSYEIPVDPSVLDGNSSVCNNSPGPCH